MKYLHTSTFFAVLLIMVCSCKKNISIDKRAIMSAKINAKYLNVNNALALLEKSSFFNGKGQLTIKGEDDSSRITIILKDYEGKENAKTLDNVQAIAVYYNKTSNISDTSVNGLLRITQVISNYYAIPDLQPSQYSSGQVYKSEIIVGTFEFTTRNNVQITNGFLGISFNK